MIERNVVETNNIDGNKSKLSHTMLYRVEKNDKRDFILFQARVTGMVCTIDG
jgi:hypothetical protein